MARDPLEGNVFGGGQQQAFNQTHRHKGTPGQGEKVDAVDINWEEAIKNGAGPILTSPDGTKYRIIVTNKGQLGVDKIT